MLSKVSLAFLVVAATQVSASALHPLLQRSNSELLYIRQATCDTQCGAFQTAVQNCTSVDCICTAANSRLLQTCINCAVGPSSSADVVKAANDLATSFDTSCSSANVPAVTVPGGAGPTGTGSGTATSSRAPTISSTTPPGTSTTPRVTVTTTGGGGGLVPTLTQTVVRGSTTGDADPSATSGGGDAPGGLSGNAVRGVSQKGVALALVAIVAGALVL